MQLDPPPPGAQCVDGEGNPIAVGDSVEACGEVFEVKSIIYDGFEDRAAAEMWDDLGFLVSPNDEGYDCVNAEDCVKVIV